MASGEVSGRVLSVAVETAGDEILVDMLAASQTIYLTDASDFDEDGGQCLIDGHVYTYDSVDMDGNSIHLTTGLTSNESAETRVDAYDPDTGNPVTITSALVTLDGQDDGDPVDAEVDHALVPLLEREVRTEGLSVTMVPDGGGFRLTQINGKNNPSKVTGSGTLWQSGYDMGNGSIIGVEAHSAGSPNSGFLWLRGMALGGLGAVNVMDETGAFMPVKASAFATQAATFYSGSSVPSFNANQGDFYFRTSAPLTANQRIYINTAAGNNWLGIA